MLNLLLAFCLFLSGLSFNSNTSAQLEGSGLNAPITVGKTEGPLGGLLIAVNDLSVSEEDSDDLAIEESKAVSNSSESSKDYVSNIDNVEKALADGYDNEVTAPVGCGPMVRRCHPTARHCEPVARQCHPVARRCEPAPRRCYERPVARCCKPKAHRCCKRRRHCCERPVARYCEPAPRRCYERPVARQCHPVVRRCEPAPRRCYERPVARQCHPVVRRCEPAPRRCAGGPVGCAGERRHSAPVMQEDSSDDGSEEMVHKTHSSTPTIEEKASLRQPLSSSQGLW